MDLVVFGAKSFLGLCRFWTWSFCGTWSLLDLVVLWDLVIIGPGRFWDLVVFGTWSFLDLVVLWDLVVIRPGRFWTWSFLDLVVFGTWLFLDLVVLGTKSSRPGWLLEGKSFCVVFGKFNVIVCLLMAQYSTQTDVVCFPDVPWTHQDETPRVPRALDRGGN